MSKHLCAVPGCGKEAPPNGSMCVKHWCLVPTSLKEKMRAAFFGNGAPLEREAIVLAQKADRAAAAVPALRGLTEIQPWGWAIIAGHKGVENRTWCPTSGMVGQPICIHGGKKYDAAAAAHIASMLELDALPPQRGDQGILGVAWLDRIHDWEADPEASDNVLSRKDIWNWRSDDRFGWLLRDVIAFPEPIACRGAQGLWPVPADVAAKVWYRVQVERALKS